MRLCRQVRISAPGRLRCDAAGGPVVSSTSLVDSGRLGGVARYENDYYHQISQDVVNVPGNPWFICTLWLAQWHIATAQTVDDLKPALDILDWAEAHALPSGVMAEQVHPYTNEALSVSPLTWSHASLVMTVRDYMAREAGIRQQLRR